jgi:hypothetical protein
MELLHSVSMKAKCGNVSMNHFKDGSLLMSVNNPHTINTLQFTLEEARELNRKLEELISRMDAERDDYIGDEPNEAH